MDIPVVAVVGRPNVGKSSLLNCLAKKFISIVDPVAGTTRDRVSVFLEFAEREFEVLRYFMERPERVLTREQLLAGAWQEGYEGTDRTVDNVVSSLRRKLGEDRDHPRHLRTVWGIGYRWIP